MSCKTKRNPWGTGGILISISLTKTLLHLHSNVDIQTCCDGFQQCLVAALKQERLCKFHPEHILCDVWITCLAD